jgi:NAD kinase
MLGVNTGRLGFLANNSKQDFENLFQQLLKKISNRAKNFIGAKVG